MRYDDEYENEEEYDCDRPRKKRGGRLNRILFFFAVLIVAVGTYIACLGYEMYSRAVTALPLDKMAENIRAEEHFTPFDEIPDFYSDAVVAVEDRRFYSHSGFDIISIGRAAVINFRERRLAEGGSTITQQLAKNVYFTQEKSFIRKAAELFAALDIERNFSKEEILELYMNIIYYGDDCYNIYDASMNYFGKPPSELDKFECSLLAGIPNAPSVYAPTVNSELSLQRQKQVLDAMVMTGYMTESEAAEIMSDKESHGFRSNK